MGKFKISNSTYIIVGLLITTCCLAFLLLISFITKGYIHNYTIQQLGSTGDFFNGIVSPFISIVSAILIYIAFKQQVDINKDQKVDKDFDRYIKLIEDIEKSEMRIKVSLYNATDDPYYNELNRVAYGNEGIETYIHFMKDTTAQDIYYINLNEAEKTLNSYFTSVNFILDGINTFDNEMHNILLTKFMLTTPLLEDQLSELVQLNEVMTADKTRTYGIELYKRIVILKQALEFTSAL